MTVVPATGLRVAGLAEDILRGDAPLAVGRFVERHHPNIPRLLGDGAAPATEMAFHLVPTSLVPARSSKEAGAILAARSREIGFSHELGRLDQVDPAFPYLAAIQASDGQWLVGRMQPFIGGAPVANQRLAAYAFNSVDSTVTRMSERVKLVSHQSAGFPFRHGVDTVPVRRPNFSPEGFLGDSYQPVVVDAHLAKAREAAERMRTELAAVRPTRFLGIGPARVEGADMFRTGNERGAMWNSLMAMRTELDRLLPDELGLVAVDDALRADTARLRAGVDGLLQRLSDLPHSQLRETVDFPVLRSQLEDIAARIDELPPAPAPGTARMANTDLPEFEALLQRLASGSFLAQDDALRVFDYARFGRTPAERMRNVGVAIDTLWENLDYSMRSIDRLKPWLRDLADDATLVRRDLAPEHRELDVLLAQVEDNARRNGQYGIVRNASGKTNHNLQEDPDYAEVGAMGASLRTYLAIDDAGRAIPATSEAPTAEMLRW